MRQLLSKERMLGEAIEIAASVHKRDKDMGGVPYILHPMRIMNAVERKYGRNYEMMAAAIMHDVIEDSKGTKNEVTVETLYSKGFSEAVIDAVDALTKRDGEEYETYLVRVASNKYATLIKLEDLKDNSDLFRLKGLREKDFKRMDKYIRAFDFLKNIATSFKWL